MPLWPQLGPRLTRAPGFLLGTNDRRLAKQIGHCSVSIGGQETALFLGQGEHIARLLNLHRPLRIDVAPIQIAPHWGVTVLDLPGRLPLPAKISIEVLAPIDQREELRGDGGDPDAGYELITRRMQDALRELDEARALPLIGGATLLAPRARWRA